MFVSLVRSVRVDFSIERNGLSLKLVNGEIIECKFSSVSFQNTASIPKTRVVKCFFQYDKELSLIFIYNPFFRVYENILLFLLLQNIQGVFSHICYWNRLELSHQALSYEMFIICLN